MLTFILVNIKHYFAMKRLIFFSVCDTGIRGKSIPSSPARSRTLNKQRLKEVIIRDLTPWDTDAMCNYLCFTTEI